MSLCISRGTRRHSFGSRIPGPGRGRKSTIDYYADLSSLSAFDIDEIIAAFKARKGRLHSSLLAVTVRTDTDRRSFVGGVGPGS